MNEGRNPSRNAKYNSLDMDDADSIFSVDSKIIDLVIEKSNKFPTPKVEIAEPTHDSFDRHNATPQDYGGNYTQSPPMHLRSPQLSHLQPFADQEQALSYRSSVLYTGRDSMTVGEDYHDKDTDLEIKQGWRHWYYTIRPKNFYKMLFMGVSVVCALVVLGLQIYIFALYFLNLDTNGDSSIKKRAVGTYLALFIYAVFYQIVITISALRLKSRVMVFLLLIFVGCMVIYSGIQYTELRHSLDPSSSKISETPQRVVVAIICILVGTFVAQVYIFLFHLKQEFSWKAFKTIGASVEAQSRLSKLQYYRALLFFDAFFFPAFTLQFIIMMPKVEKTEMVLTAIVIPLSVALLVFADYSACNEILPGSIVCILGYLLGLVYAFFKVVRIYTHNTDRHQYFPGRKSLTLFAVFSIILLITTGYFAVITTRNFNKGLKPIVSKAWNKILHRKNSNKRNSVSLQPITNEEFAMHETSNNHNYKKPPQTMHQIIVD